MYRITKVHHFSAAHQLDHLPRTHPCARLHGHNYIVEFVLEAPLLRSPEGWVRDYGDLKVATRWIDEHWDHTNLNGWPGLKPTTAERLAAYLYDMFKPELPELVAVRVSETPKTWAEYRQDPDA